MTATEIYQEFCLPPNLQEHLLRVTALANFIAENWIGDSLDKNILPKSTLLHDLGNIIKFDFSRPELLGSEAANIEKWKMVKEEMIAKYGPDEHAATEEMSREIGVDEKVLYVVSHTGFSRYEEIESSDNWEVKVCTYSDHRTSPFGYMTLKERFDELIKRYSAGGRVSSHTSERAPKLIELGFAVEKQIQSKANFDLSLIDGGAIEQNKDQFGECVIV